MALLPEWFFGDFCYDFSGGIFIRKPPVEISGEAYYADFVYTLFYYQEMLSYDFPFTGAGAVSLPDWDRICVDVDYAFDFVWSD